MERRVATPAGTARAEDPGLSAAREAAEAVPAESVRSQRKSPFQLYLYFKRKKPVGKHQNSCLSTLGAPLPFKGSAAF
ncbi:hypothetical protein ACA30_01280 [Virgibacillus soli]|nr:hypothetical protein ACA30_01280 [Virgibacillus soli]